MVSKSELFLGLVGLEIVGKKLGGQKDERLLCQGKQALRVRLLVELLKLFED